MEPVTTPKARQASLREHNLGLVARAVFGAERPPSRAAIAAATGLTRATVSTLVDQLVGARVVRELPPEPGNVGRPAVPLVPASRTVVGLGLEVNVGYLGVRAVDLAGDTVVERIERGDFHASDPAVVLPRLADLAREVVAGLDAEGVRVAGARLALPGLVDVRDGHLVVAPNLGWADLDPVPLLGPLRAADDIRVRIANEANLAGLAQLRFGWFAGDRAGDGDVLADVAERSATEAPDLARGGTTFVYLSVDVGVGAAVLLEGALYVGRRGWAGEIGHVAVEPDGPLCQCGARGCLEAVAGKLALLAAFGRGPSDDLDVDEIAVRAAAGDPEVTDVLERVGTFVGRALAAVVNVLDVDTLLLGGLYATLADALHGPVVDELRRRVPALPERLVVAAAPVVDHAALTGGARAVLRDVVRTPSAFVGASTTVSPADTTERAHP
ncbi:ROK family protein [Luteimicrobium subarcticum]|uniref:Putative NBD/HSP70 family sugar kinase n=1 Tax=Luteimicrobium subarcticum TaxID=620910 RepID=A0A2M8WS57_9MICO|nr:ROK family protein [Luteimicrobium subarcticum]PJI93753.1 putative NBD/HSP70 family sugar kinase [Luteimicrobium subarcticum]